MGENPGRATLTGGAIVLAAVIANEAFAAWRGRGAAARTPAPDRLARERAAPLRYDAGHRAPASPP